MRGISSPYNASRASTWTAISGVAMMATSAVRRGVTGAQIRNSAPQGSRQRRRRNGARCQEFEGSVPLSLPQSRSEYSVPLPRKSVTELNPLRGSHTWAT